MEQRKMAGAFWTGQDFEAKSVMVIIRDKEDREIVGTVRSTETGAGQISTGSRRRLRGRHKNALLVALPAEYVEQAEECHAGS